MGSEAMESQVVPPGLELDAPTIVKDISCGEQATAPAFDSPSLATLPYDHNDGEIPMNYLVAHDGNVERARNAFHDTIQWRKDNKIAELLHTPQPNFKIIKEFYPWYLHRSDKKGNAVVYYRLGQLKMPKLCKLVGGSKEIERHNLFYQEYLWTRLKPKPTDKVTIVFDLKHLYFHNATSEVLALFKNALSTQSKHWPARTDKSFIVNAPVWFSYIFALIRPLLNQRQRDKVSILDEQSTYHGLAEWIDEENIPREYGEGQREGAISFGESEEEKQLWAYVTKITADAGMSFRAADVEDSDKGESAAHWWGF